MFSFTSCNPNNSNDPTSSATITDKDGNVYHTVKIGTQTWMVENLRTTKYSDGTSIPVVTDNTVWSNLLTGACCNYNNDEANSLKYGKLYNWYAVNTGKIAPIGWHVPTNEEWTMLENYLSVNIGTSGSVAKALATTTDWLTSTNVGAIGNDLSKNNTCGFFALPGGLRYSGLDAQFSDLGKSADWWTSTEFTTVYSKYMAYSRTMYYYESSVLTFSTSIKMYGMSIRCIKDN